MILKNICIKMRLLIDTHAFLWFVNDDPKRSEYAKKRIESGLTVPLVSIASLWEIAIKWNLKKINLETSFDGLIAETLKYGFEFLPVRPEHLIVLSSLSLHHRDPFDRLLISQAMSEGIAIISKDANFKLYDIKTL